MNRFEPLIETAKQPELADLAKLLAESGPTLAPDSLRPHVCAIVERMKAAGKSPEVIRLAIQSVCRDYGFVSGEYVAGIRRGGPFEIVDRLTTACIEKLFL